MIRNYATSCSIVDVSTPEELNYEAKNMLTDDNTSLWLGKLAPNVSFLLRLPGSDERQVAICSIGMYNWQRSTNNPRSIRLEVSSNGSDFVEWSEFEVKNATDKFVGFDISPIPLEIQFLRFTIVHTFNVKGRQTYMNRLFLHGESLAQIRSKLGSEQALLQQPSDNVSLASLLSLDTLSTSSAKHIGQDIITANDTISTIHSTDTRRQDRYVEYSKPNPTMIAYDVKYDDSRRTSFNSEGFESRVVEPQSNPARSSKEDVVHSGLRLALQQSREELRDDEHVPPLRADFEDRLLHVESQLRSLKGDVVRLLGDRGGSLSHDTSRNNEVFLEHQDDANESAERIVYVMRTPDAQQRNKKKKSKKKGSQTAPHHARKPRLPKEVRAHAHRHATPRHPHHRRKESAMSLQRKLEEKLKERRMKQELLDLHLEKQQKRIEAMHEKTKSERLHAMMKARETPYSPIRHTPVRKRYV